MTTHQVWVFNGLYFVLSVAVALVTRATARRIVGAMAGGLAAGVAALGIIALGEKTGRWHLQMTWSPYFLLLLVINFALCAYVFLITWRIARRFGARGLAVVVIVAALIGPPRDYWYMSHFPEWGTYTWDIRTVLAISAAYVFIGALGHGVMRLVSGPAGQDRLARSPRH